MSKATELNTLRQTIRQMDALSQEGFTDVAAIAKLIKAALKAANFSDPQNMIIPALGQIVDRAGDAENCINSEAEEVGCNFFSPELSLAIAESLERAVAASGVDHD
jgi:hypothetical protein